MANKVMIKKIHAQLKKAYASNVLRLHQAKIRFYHWRLRHGLKLATLPLVVAVISSFFAAPFLQRVTGGYFAYEDRLSALRSLLGGTGAALIGAAAIAFSLVVFAMQINVERMPHGLFRQLSSDRRLLGSFLGSFLIALLVAGTSLIPNGSWGIYAIIVAIFGVAIIVLLFLYAYRRALQLINPIEQLSIMSRIVRQDLRKWSQLADKAVILLIEAPQADVANDGIELHFDAAKAHFYKVNSHWTKPAKQAIQYIISYANRFAAHGDYEVTDNAFMRMMLINATYCSAKRGTFIGSNPLFEIPEATDDFINTSLEQLRQTMQAALSNGDERLAGSTLRAIGSLYGVYLRIEYPGLNRSKHHALLASGYLGSAVESVIPHNMPDLMMEGIRLMGRASRLALDHTNPKEIVGMSQKIAALSYVGVIKPNHQPVTLIAFEQLADVTHDLLVKGKHDIRFSAHKLRSAVTEASKMFLDTPETPLDSKHRNTLGPYFSSTSISSLHSRLTTLVNNLLEASSDNTQASVIIENIEVWADQIYVSQKELFLLAIQKRSSFTFDLISWAVGVSGLLNALSNAPACARHSESKLRKHAIWLISTLSWIPDDIESVNFAESHSLTENLFDAASDGLSRGCVEFYESCKRLLIDWAKKGGKHETGWGIMETTVEALVALTIMEGTPAAAVALNAQFSAMLASEGAPSTEIRANAAAHLTRSANEFRQYGTMHSQIDTALAQLDHASVRARLLEMVEVLTPGSNADD